jgi:hypothetical protein
MKTNDSSITDLKQAVEELAAMEGEKPGFTLRAAKLADQLGEQSIPQLSKLYHGDPCPPPQYAEAFSGLGHWLSAKQFAIFEIYFHIGRPALTELRSVAFGEYDWIQGNALEVLCRFAAAGMDRDEIIQDIKRESPYFREEALFYALGPLIPLEDAMPGLKDVLTELREVEEIESAYEFVRRGYVERVQAAERKAGEDLKAIAEGERMAEPKRTRPWWKFWGRE